MRSRRSALAAVAAALAAAAAAAAAPAPAPGWRPAEPGHRWVFPRDHHAHPGYRNEWWYFTGTLADAADPSRRFGYQLTFFRVGLLPEAPRLDSAWAASDAVMVHLAVTDVAARRHVFSEALWRAVPLLGGFPAEPDPILAWARAPPGTEGRATVALEGETFRLRARDAARGIALDLALRPSKPVVLQGPDGLSRKAADTAYASLYYSLTRLETEGTLEVGGASRLVRGESWMDKEMGSSQLAPDQVGWDWWSLRLADGRDLTLYVLRRAGGATSWRTATLIERDGRVTLLPDGAWAVRTEGTWRSATSGATYPSRWDIDVHGAGIRVRAIQLVEDAENRSALAPGLSYWEGPVGLTGPEGRPAGEGYVELTGYTVGGRLPL